MIKFGSILKPVGLQGEVKVFSDSDFVNDRLKKGYQFKANDEILTVSKAVISGNVHKVKFTSINSIEEAQNYRGVDLYLLDNDDSLLNDDEFFHHELVGCQVIENEEVIGEVISLESTGAHEVLRIKDQEQIYLIPFVKAFVSDVNIKEKKIVVNLIEGMR